MGAEEVRSCLYTKRLTQKLKKWQDGSILLDRSTGRVVLRSDKDEIVLSTHVNAQDMQGGWEQDEEVKIEDKYLVEIGSLIGGEGSTVNTALPPEPPTSASFRGAGNSRFIKPTGFRPPVAPQQLRTSNGINHEGAPGHGGGSSGAGPGAHAPASRPRFVSPLLNSSVSSYSSSSFSSSTPSVPPPSSQQPRPFQGAASPQAQRQGHGWGPPSSRPSAPPGPTRPPPYSAPSSGPGVSSERLQLYLLSPSSSGLCRRVSIPTTFASARDYCRAVRQAVTEEVNLAMAEHASAHMQQQGVQHRGTGAGPQLQCYDGVEVIVSRKRKANDNATPAERAEPIKPRCFVKLKGNTPTQQGGGRVEHNRGDLWVLCARRDFGGAGGGGAPQYVGESLWHAPSADGMLELSILDGVLPVPTPSSYSQGGGGRGNGRQGKQGGRFGREHDEAPRGPSSYFAFKGPNLQLLLLIRELVSDPTVLLDLPLLATLLCPGPPQKPTLPTRLPLPAPQRFNDRLDHDVDPSSLEMQGEGHEEQEEEDEWSAFPCPLVFPHSNKATTPSVAPSPLCSNEGPAFRAEPLGGLGEVIGQEEENDEEAGEEDGEPLSVLGREAVEGKMNDIVRHMGLNHDQQQVMGRVCDWLSPPLEARPRAARGPIVLVHGVFGSGKSRLLAAICLFVGKVAQAQAQHGPQHGGAAPPSALRILLACATNVAVDRVLLELLEHGFDSMVRVGSSRRVHPRLEPYLFTATTSATNSKVTPAANGEGGGGNASISAFARLHGEAVVVGVTCASCPTLLEQAEQATAEQPLSFPLVLMDEASQMPEPVSLLPLIAAGQPQKLLLVGDPQQLPPPLSRNTSCPATSMHTPLFVRLAQAGLAPILLRTQYRCHPMLARLASELFYQGQLTSGISEQDRGPQVTGLPPLLLVDASAQGQEQQVGGESFVNHVEVSQVTSLIMTLTKPGPSSSWRAVREEEVGVICPYRAQAAAIQSALQAKGIGGKVKVSTVDAFQGAEREVIVYSCTRTQALGFLDSPNRLNVSITRAKRHLLLVGHGRFLSSCDSLAWRTLMGRAVVLPSLQHLHALLRDNEE